MLGGSEFCPRKGFRQRRKRLHGASAPPQPAGPHTLLASMLFGCHKDRQTSPEVCRSFLSSFPTLRHPMGRLQFLVWRSDAILRVISTGMYGILEWMRGSSQSNHIILRRNGSTCVQNDARYFPWVLPCRCIIIKNFWIPFLAFSALDVTSYQLSGLAPTHSTMPCSISVPQFKHVLFPSPALFHNFLACA